MSIQPATISLTPTTTKRNFRWPLLLSHQYYRESVANHLNGESDVHVPAKRKAGEEGYGIFIKFIRWGIFTDEEEAHMLG